MGWGWGEGDYKLKAPMHVQVKWGSKITKSERSYFMDDPPVGGVTFLRSSKCHALFRFLQA